MGRWLMNGMGWRGQGNKRDWTGLDWTGDGGARHGSEEGCGPDEGARIQDLNKSHRSRVRIGSKVRRTAAKRGG